MNRLINRLTTLLGPLAAVLIGLGCGASQPTHSGIYVSRIWTVPGEITAGALVELHMDEVYDLPPDVAILPVVKPVHWTVSAGELYEKTLDGEWLKPLDEQPGVQEFDSFILVMWRVPGSVRKVNVTAQQYGHPLTVTFLVHDPPVDDGLGGRIDQK